MAESVIPLEAAVVCCKAYREENKVRVFSQCWGCQRFSKGNPENRCFYKPPTNRGCKFVNEKYEENREKSPRQGSKKA